MPCRIIVILSELFRAELMSQVYANLHQYFSDHPAALETLIFTISLLSPFPISVPTLSV